MIILTVLSIGLLAGGAYVFSAVVDEREARVRRAELIRKGYIL